MSNALLDGTVKDQNGVVVPGASVYVYDGRGEDGGLALLYDNLSQAVPNPVTTDDDGYWSAYAATDRFYTTAIYFGGRKRYVESNVLLGTLGISTDPNLRSDIAATGGAALIGSTGPSTVQADINARPTSAALAAATGAGLVGFTQSGTGAVARTAQAKMRETISVDDFGAVGDGSTDDTAAFNLAIAYLNTLTQSAGLLLTPNKNYKISGSLDAFTTNRKYIIGRGSRITHDSGTLFTWGAGVANGVVDGGIIGLDYMGASPPTAGTCVVEQSGMNRLLLQDITGTNVNQFLKAGTTALAGGYFIRNVRLTTYNAAVNVIDHGDGSNSSIQGLDMTASASSGVSRTLDETTLTGALATAFKFGSGNWDTAVWNGLLINGYAYGLDIDRSSTGENVSNFRVSDFYFDYCAAGIHMKNSVGSGGINNMVFSNGWVVGMDGHGVHLDGSVGSHRSIIFMGIHSLLAGKNNWRLTSSVMSGVKLIGCTGDFANRLNGSNTGSDQDGFVATFGGFTCRDGRFGRSADGIVASSVPNWQARYGFNGPTGTSDWIFENNEIEGKTADTSIAIGSTTLASGKLFSSSVLGNRVVGGAAKPAYATTASVTAPTSTQLQTNNTPFHYELYFYSGTVTGVSKNSTTVADTVPARLDIRPGDTWSVTYSVAPTIKRVIKS